MDDTHNVSDQPLELDLTNAHLPNLSTVAISPSHTLIDLTANRLDSLDDRLLSLTGLKSINLRQNLLTDVSSWSSCSCKSALEDMEFRDNQITQIPDLAGFTALRRVEFSYNQIRSLAPLEHLQPQCVEELYVACNKISAISTSLSHLTRLTVLELGSNRLRVVEGLEFLTALQELWLGRNRLTTISGLTTLTNLVKLSLQSNRLTCMAGLEACISLQELYLSHNGITRLEGLQTLVQLDILDVSSNRLQAVDHLHALSKLRDLWLNDNQIPALDAALKQGLAPVAATLTTLYLENNPAAADKDYKATVLSWLPHLEQLDANHV